MNHPVAVGGVGGSGTRLVAQWLRDLGLAIGDDLNHALDNLWFSLFFKRRDVLLLPAHELERRQRVFLDRAAGALEVTDDVRRLVEELARTADPKYADDWLAARTVSFLSPPPAPHAYWGWKEPNTHLLLEPFLAVEPRLRYVHLYRNGLEMAYSRNNQQVRLWGPVLLGRDVSGTPRDKLAYWCAAHRRMTALAEQYGDRVLLVRFESLLADPAAELGRLADFTGVVPPPGAVDALVADLRTPVDRVAERHAEELDPADLDYLRSVGYDLSRS